MFLKVIKKNSSQTSSVIFQSFTKTVWVSMDRLFGTLAHVLRNLAKACICSVE